LRFALIETEKNAGKSDEAAAVRGLAVQAAAVSL
jgi:hypothetical protein